MIRINGKINLKSIKYYANHQQKYKTFLWNFKTK